MLDENYDIETRSVQNQVRFEEQLTSDEMQLVGGASHAIHLVASISGSTEPHELIETSKEVVSDKLETFDNIEVTEITAYWF